MRFLLKLFIVFIVLAVAVAASVDPPPPSQPSSASESDTDEASAEASESSPEPEPNEDVSPYYSARHAVRQVLNDPDSAEFPTIESGEWAASEVDDDRWLVQGEVSATNAFNATVRNAWQVEFIDEGEQIRALFIEVGGEVMMDVRDEYDALQ